MSELIEKGKLYKPEDVRNPYFVVPFLLVIIGFGIYGLTYYIQKPSEYLFFILFLPFAIIVCSYLIYIHFYHYVYAEVKSHSLILKNHFKKWPKEIFFNEITEIIANKKWWYDVLVKDTKGQKIVINTAIEPTDEFFNELITRAVNCKKIDLQNIKKDAPNLLLYKKNDNS